MCRKSCSRTSGRPAAVRMPVEVRCSGSAARSAVRAASVKTRSVIRPRIARLLALVRLLLAVLQERRVG